MDLEEIYKKYLKKGDKIIIACSGGCDSIYLLYKSTKVCKKLGIEIIIAHLNHKLRGKAADEDEKFILELAKKLKLTAISSSKNFKSFSEEKGRKVRQEFFEKIRKQFKAKFVIVAHHLDDNTETILMNFARGSGLTGLRGIKELAKKTLRPLLNIEKQEILKYLKKHKIKFTTDATNKNNSYTRNFYRNKVIPLIKEKNPNLNETLKKSAQNFSELNKFINQKAYNWIKNHRKYKKYDLKSFRKQHIALQKEILRELYKKTKGDLQELESKHIEEIIDFLTNSHSGKHKNLGKYTEVKIQGKTFSIKSL